MTEPAKNQSENAALAATMKDLLQEQLHRLPEAGAPSFIVVPQGRKAESLKPLLDEYLKAPERRKGTSVHKTLKSLIDHVQAFGTKDAVLFADPGDGLGKDAVILALLNYNPATKNDREANWGDHRARYSVPLSDEWKAWKAIDGKNLDQRTFARFLETRIEDLADPATAGLIAKQIPEKLGLSFATPTAMLQFSKGLEVRVGRTVSSSYDPSTGEQLLHFEEKHTDKHGGALNPPKAFLLNIPVFQQGTVFPVGARIMYAVEGSAAAYSVHLYREDLYFKAAFEEACNKASADLAVPLFIGSPE
jgi:hypothetical protein